MSDSLQFKYNKSFYNTKDLKRFTSLYLEKLPKDVTALISTGSSGCSIATSILLNCDRELKHGYIRKSDEKNHVSGNHLLFDQEISGNDVLAIVDDIIASGHTIDVILDFLYKYSYKVKYVIVHSVYMGMFDFGQKGIDKLEKEGIKVITLK